MASSDWTADKEEELFSRVLRDSISRYVGWLVRPSVGRSSAFLLILRLIDRFLGEFFFFFFSFFPKNFFHFLSFFVIFIIFCHFGHFGHF